MITYIAPPPPTPALRRLSDSTWAWMHDRTDWGYSNSGLIVSDGQAVMVDTQYTLDATRTLLAAVEEVCPLDAVGAVVCTHLNGDHTWGNQLLAGVEIIASAAGADSLCHELRPEQMSALIHSASANATADYVAAHFGHFDFSGIRVAEPTRTFTGREEIKVGTALVELLDLGAGHSAGDVAVHVPEERVVFAGDALFAQAHMVVWSMSLSGCIRACQMLLDTGAEVFVPGHGPLLDRAGVVEIRDRLGRVEDAATEYAERGVPLADAARLIMASCASTWAHPERLFTQVAAAYAAAGASDVPASMLELADGMASLAS